MKAVKIKRFILVVLIYLAIVMLLSWLVSCTSTKKIATTKQTFDSTDYKLAKDSVRMLSKEVKVLKTTLLTKKQTGVEFAAPCPPCPKLPQIPGELALMNKDSVNALIEDLNNLITFNNNYLTGLENEVKIYKDGTKEFKGRIRNYSELDEKKQETIDSLSAENDVTKLQLKEAQIQISKLSETKAVDKKTSFLQWWHFLIIGFIAGGVVLIPLDRKTKIFKFFG